MGRSFSSIFSVGEPFFGFAKLPLEVPNPSLERAEVPLGCEVQHACDALNALVDHPLDATAETKRLHRRPLNVRITHQLCQPRVLEQSDETVFEPGHRWGRRANNGPQTVSSRVVSGAGL
jgi:hypothetical protein